MSDLHRRPPTRDMKSSPTNPEDERPSRRTTLESRVCDCRDLPAIHHSYSPHQIYNFLTRSRSRSRSKQEPTDDPKSKSQKVVRRSSIKKDSTTSMSGTKPASRIPSRPLSSTTTTTSTTNTTITPATPKATKRRIPPQAAQKPLEGEVMGNGHSSRPSTPKLSAPKKTLQNLWGIPLALANRKSSRSRSRSRPNSPEPSTDVPPLPTNGVDADHTPKPRKSHSPHSRPRTPTTTSKLKPSEPISNNASTGSTSNSLRLPKLFSGTSQPLAIVCIRSDVRFTCLPLSLVSRSNSGEF